MKIIESRFTLHPALDSVIDSAVNSPEILSSMKDSGQVVRASTHTPGNYDGLESNLADSSGKALLSIAQMLWGDVQRIRSEIPLVHNITNYVVMSSTANALLAIGASPVMAHACEEVEEMVALARALVINIGTLSPVWIDAMLKAGLEAKRRGIPIVLDPVGCGATQYRTTTAQKLAEAIHPTIIRGNPSEIHALLHSGQGTRGVDSTLASEDVLEDAKALSRAYSCVVSVSGVVDHVVEGDSVVRIANGHAIMARVTGMGCIATAITGAFAAVNSMPLQAAVNAMSVVGIAGEMAAERSAGPGSFTAHFLDSLYNLQESEIMCRLKVQSNTEFR